MQNFITGVVKGITAPFVTLAKVALHPVKTAKAVVSDVLHPVDTFERVAKGVAREAHDHPDEFIGELVGGALLGGGLRTVATKLSSRAAVAGHSRSFRSSADAAGSERAGGPAESAPASTVPQAPAPSKGSPPPEAAGVTEFSSEIRASPEFLEFYNAKVAKLELSLGRPLTGEERELLARSSENDVRVSDLTYGAHSRKRRGPSGPAASVTGS